MMQIKNNKRTRKTPVWDAPREPHPLLRLCETRDIGMTTWLRKTDAMKLRLLANDFKHNTRVHLDHYGITHLKTPNMMRMLASGQVFDGIKAFTISSAYNNWINNNGQYQQQPLINHQVLEDFATGVQNGNLATIRYLIIGGMSIVPDIARPYFTRIVAGLPQLCSLTVSSGVLHWNRDMSYPKLDADIMRAILDHASPTLTTLCLKGQIDPVGDLPYYWSLPEIVYILESPTCINNIRVFHPLRIRALRASLLNPFIDALGRCVNMESILGLDIGVEEEESVWVSDEDEDDDFAEEEESEFDVYVRMFRLFGEMPRLRHVHLVEEEGALEFVKRAWDLAFPEGGEVPKYRVCTCVYRTTDHHDL